MKNVLTKMGYMAIGCLLTIIGYHFGNVENNSVTAQQSSESTGTEIVGKLRVRQLEIVGNDDTPQIILGTNLDGAEIKFIGEDNTPRIRLVKKSDRARIEILDPSGSEVVMSNGVILLKDPSGSKTAMGAGDIGVSGPNRNNEVVLSATNEFGVVSVSSNSKKSVMIGVHEDKTPFVLAGFGNNSYHHPIWTPNEDNNVTEIYEKRTTKTTKSLDFDRYKPAPSR